jgi:hypothetical protein
MKDDLVITKTVNESTGVTTIAVKDNGGNDISSTTIGENYVATDVGLGAGQLKDGKKFILEADGTLNADNAIIHGAIFANEGYIAGWHVSQSKSGEDYSGSLTYGELGQATGFHMYGNNYGVTGTIAGKTINTADSTHPGWKLGIGSGFGVTSDGGVYATHGKIGNLTIDAINEGVNKANNLQLGGRNLLLQSGKSVNNASYPTATYYFAKDLEINKTYTLTMRAEIGEGRETITIWAKGSNGNSDIWLFNTWDKIDSGLYSKTFSWPARAESTNGIIIYVTPSTTTSTNTIDWIKLEQGNIATDWTPAPEDATNSISTLDVKIDEIDVNVGEMVVSYVATSDGKKGATADRGNYFTATVTEATRPKEWTDMFYDGAILKINFSNTSNITYSDWINLNIGSASDESEDRGNDDTADYGFEIKPGGNSVSSTNKLEIPAQASMLFQFHATGGSDANGYTLGYWDNKNISNNSAWSGLNVKTSGISKLINIIIIK